MFTNLNGHKFYFQESGTAVKDQTPILFIHGLGSSTLDWEHQISFFEKHYKILSIDLRGHGKTLGSDEKYSISLFANDVAAFLNEKKVKVHIVGISMGGLVAFQLAVDYPELVQSMVIINSVVELPMDNPKVRKVIRLRKIVPRIMGMKMMGKVIGKKVFPYPHQGDLRVLIATRWATNKMKDYLKSVNALAGWTVKDHIHKIEQPVLVLGGDNDYTTKAEKQEYTNLLPNASLAIIPDTGHAVTMENPKAVNRIIFEFLTSNSL